ncbi:hypothetical protein FHS42_002521 [Streptomyces zagrosensis]|uniref:Uncharacterized protein n=1 Tax=Streptomyces zagrosensis TaxID=1042984 RepID=A0A7W9UZ65_9ACTN|nr:hypothetical protein [Streptomyces zagrosensis]
MAAVGTYGLVFTTALVLTTFFHRVPQVLSLDYQERNR